jgi:transcriptional regulator with XRE-family HTH domain
MPARRDPGTKAETKLARVRMTRGVTQDELADAVGISVPTYRRMERGRTKNPPLRYLVNCALALGVELDELIEEEWREWMVFDQARAEPPSPDEFWRRPYTAGLDEALGGTG